jgi:hypothetical protein
MRVSNEPCAPPGGRRAKTTTPPMIEFPFAVCRRELWWANSRSITLGVKIDGAVND